VVAAIGLARIFGALAQRGPVWPYAAAGGLTLLLLAEVVHYPFPLISADSPPVYRQLAATPGEWTMLVLPLDQNDRSLYEMYAQIDHEQPILTGRLARSVPRPPYEDMPLMQELEQADTRADIVTMAPATRTQWLRSLRVRYLVVLADPDDPTRQARQVATAHTVLGDLRAVYTDDMLEVYEIVSLATWLDGPGQTERVAVPLFVGLDQASDWQPRQTSAYGVSRWLPPVGGALSVYTPRPRPVVLEVRLAPLQAQDTLDIWLNGVPVATTPVTGPQARSYHIGPLDLPAGPSRIEFRSPNPGASPRELGIGSDGRRLAFSVLAIDIRELTTGEP
jgi:hypothetical protein